MACQRRRHHLPLACHPDNTAQAFRFGTVLKNASLAVKVFGANDIDHNKINAALGLDDDPSTRELFAFVRDALKH